MCNTSCSMWQWYLLLFTSGINDLAEVLSALKNCYSWKPLGLALGLFYPTLERIGVEQHGVIEACKREMLAAWLQQQDNVTGKGIPRWAVLKAAVAGIGETKLASEIGQWVVCVCACVCMWVCMYMCTYVCVCTYIYVCVAYMCVHECVVCMCMYVISMHLSLLSLVHNMT